MRPDRPSFTATVVAFGRGIGLDPVRRDPVAGALLPPPFQWALRGFERLAPGPRARLLARAGTLGLVDHATLRMVAVDAAVEESVTRGCTQVVVLGAGLDARPWRMEVLREATVFELDHPATQRHKRSRIAFRPPLARRVELVPIDFARERLDAVLAQVGHDADRPTLWLWEAVTMYLPPEAIDATLRCLSNRSAHGSELVLSYVVPELVPGLRPRWRRVARGLFRALGEPLVGAMGPDEVTHRLSAAGFRVREDSSSREWAARLGIHGDLAHVFRGERLAVATRGG